MTTEDQKSQANAIVEAAERGERMTAGRLAGKFIEFDGPAVYADVIGTIALGASPSPRSILYNGTLGVASFVFRRFPVLKYRLALETGGPVRTVYEHLVQISDAEPDTDIPAIARRVAWAIRYRGLSEPEPGRRPRKIRRRISV